jgi:MFS family permease
MRSLSSTFSSLRHRNFRLFFTGQLISFIGVWMHTVALSWLVYDLTRSRFLLGLVNALGSLPLLALSPYGGTLADRFDKRRLLLLTQSSAMLFAWVLGGLVALGSIRIWHIFLLATLVGIDSALDTPTRQSFIFEMVGKEDLTNAIALNSTIFNASRVIGPALAGIIISEIGLAPCFFVNGLTYLAIIYALLSMRFDHPALPSRGPSSLRRGLREAIHYARSHPAILALLTLVAISSIFALQFVIMMPVFARDILGGGPRTLGALMTATGLGAMGGALNLATYGNRGGRTTVLLGGSLFFYLSLLAFTLSTRLHLSLFLLVLVGLFMISFLATANTLLQLAVSNELRGRIMGFFVTALLGMAPLGSLQLGFLAQRWGAPAALRVGLAVCLLCWGLLFPRLRAIESKGRQG